MAAADSFVGEGLNPSPYKEAMAENERLRTELRLTLSAISQAFHCIDSTDNRELSPYERTTALLLNECYMRLNRIIRC